MNMYFKLSLGVIFTCLALPSWSVDKFGFQPGEIVLTDCNLIYNKGTVQKVVTDGYVVHFKKDSRPINCPPFRWHHEFVFPFESISEYRLQFSEPGFLGSSRDITFRVGERVSLRLDRDKRILTTAGPVDIEAEITDISTVGAIAVKMLNSDPDSVLTFWQWVGTNYIDLRHKALELEREKRSQ